MSDELLESLTNREREVLALIGRGYSLAEIADQLYRSQKTIQTHRLALGRKLGVGNRVELARIAIQAGLAPLDSPIGGDSAAGQADVSGEVKAWQTLQAIVQNINTASGPRYFRLLVEGIAKHFNVTTAGVSELSKDGRWFHTVAVVERDKVHEEITYPVAKSACETALEAPVTFVREGAQERFPDDTPLIEMKAEAYLAARLEGDDGRPIGVLWATHTQRIDESCEPDKILRILANRTAAELARWRVFNELLELREDLEERVEARTAELASANQQLERTIDALRAAQNEARDKERRFSLLVESMSDGLGIIDKGLRLTYVNPQYERIVGRPAEDLVGRSPSEWMTPEDAEMFRTLRRDRPNVERDRYNVTFVRPDGQRVRVTVTPRSLFDTDGQYQGAVAILSEIRPGESHQSSN